MHLTRNNLLCNKQYGFRSFISTVNALPNFKNKFDEALDASFATTENL